MTPERRGARFSLEEVTRLARETALQYGGHVPMLIAEGDTGSIVGQLADLPATHEGRIRYLHAAGMTLARSRQVGVLERIYMVSEGWMAIAAEDGTIEHPPSQDPNRKEVLLISTFQVEEQRTEMALFEMIRDETGMLTELEPLETPDAGEGGYVDSPLLAAFVEGFRQATGGQFN